MKERIIEAIDQPEALERLYRTEPVLFTAAFAEVSENYDTELVRWWKIRLKPDPKKYKKASFRHEIVTAALIIIVMILALRIPSLFNGVIIEEYYARFVAVIVFSGLITWFAIRKYIFDIKKILFLAVPVLVLALWLEFLPQKFTDTVILSIIHSPVFLWFIFGLSWLGSGWKEKKNMASFFRFNGELAIMSGLILIAFFILSGMTISLFAMLGMEISKFYMENVGISGITVSPLIAAFLIDIYPEITAKIPPVIARIFAPLVLVSAIIYLTAMAFSGINIRENRDFLIIFNLLLAGVMAIIVFSLSVQNKSSISKFQLIILFLLSVVTLIIDIIALQAIFSRLGLGFTPNRTVTVLSNLLILINLVLIIPPLFQAGFQGKSSWPAENMIYRYLPVYFAYSAVIIFIFPLIFGFR